ncbi:unnamed protein product [Linum trigynum]|uniref:Uncharacterized protein n=1 Tax=Linum trigynum TaxID=586398 RepID=A0AAV2DAX7_9ROSI
MEAPLYNETCMLKQVAGAEAIGAAPRHHESILPVSKQLERKPWGGTVGIVPATMRAACSANQAGSAICSLYYERC